MDPLTISDSIHTIKTDITELKNNNNNCNLNEAKLSEL